MKILVAHNYYKQPGGEDQCVAAEVAMLTAHGHEVIPYAVRNDAIDEMNRLDMAARTVWCRPAYHEVRGLMQAHRPEIAHFHNTFPLISPAGYYAARAENVAVIQTLHNFRLLCPNALLFRNGKICEDCLGKSIAWPGVVHGCYRGSRAASAATAAMLAVHRALGTWQGAVDVYIALTEFSRQKFIQGGLPPDKIVVKPNFVHPDPGTGRGNGGYGLFVGRLSQEKGLETLLGAWKSMHEDLPLRIVGDGPLSAMVEEAAAKDRRIQWLGRRSAQEVSELMDEALYLVFPSRCYETFGRVLIEAFAKGTPVLVSNSGAMAELVDHGRTGLHFERGNPVDLAAKVQRLLGEPKRLKEMRQAARQTYERKYTAESNYRALLAVYEQALVNRHLAGERRGLSPPSGPPVQARRLVSK